MTEENMENCIMSLLEKLDDFRAAERAFDDFWKGKTNVTAGLKAVDSLIETANLTSLGTEEINASINRIHNEMKEYVKIRGTEKDSPEAEKKCINNLIDIGEIAWETTELLRTCKSIAANEKDKQQSLLKLKDSGNQIVKSFM